MSPNCPSLLRRAHKFVYNVVVEIFRLSPLFPKSCIRPCKMLQMRQNIAQQSCKCNRIRYVVFASFMWFVAQSHLQRFVQPFVAFAVFCRTVAFAAFKARQPQSYSARCPISATIIIYIQLHGRNMGISSYAHNIRFQKLFIT